MGGVLLMIKSVIKVILISSMGLVILLLIPDLFSPVAAAIDSVLDTDLLTVTSNVYDAIGSDFMILLVMQFSTLAIIIIIRFVIGGKK